MTQEKNITSQQVLDKFCVAGINYHGADTEVRGLFSVSPEAFEAIATTAKAHHLRSVLVVSTCNRTEIYGFAEHVQVLINLLLPHTRGTAEQFLQYGYLKNGSDAVMHLFRVASGLDSQILGDYEILGQLKQSMDHAMNLDMIGPLMNRTLNYAIQASKKIKTNTQISTGTVSVSYAAIELLKAIPGIAGKNILVIGAGKFGSNVCKNIKGYLPGTAVTITNRTNETALELAAAAGLQHLPFENLEAGIQQADIIIVCTNATSYTIQPSFFKEGDPKLILDLSVPVNVDPSVKQLEGITVTDVDEISAGILDKTFDLRKKEIPKAEAILLQYMQEYNSWLDEYRYSLHIKNWKDKLQELNGWPLQSCCEMAENYTLSANDQKVQKAVSRLAVNLRTSNEKGCQFINAVNDYLQM
ncbi:MAG: glutamyl-tRNA reductase [Ferruginibacter sp.]